MGPSSRRRGNRLYERLLLASLLLVQLFDSTLLELRCGPELLQFRRYRHLYSLCRHYPKVALFVEHGLKEAIKECQYQMRFDRWDCSHSTRTGKQRLANRLAMLDEQEGGGRTERHVELHALHEPPILRYGYRESAFLLAISSAGVAWSVARGCAKGHLEQCACDAGRQTAEQNWKWAGCSYGVKFGLVSSRRLFSSRRRLRTRQTRRGRQRRRTFLQLVEKHNLKAGRVALKRTLKRACKCNGMSGSCQMKTCWQSVSNLRAIGAELKGRYEKAVDLTRHSRSRRRVVASSSRRPTKLARSAELVYAQRSPDFCRPVPRLRHAATGGRVCHVRADDGSWTAGGGCEPLCCGRPISVHRETYARQCDCRFVWCCEVECRRCNATRVVHYCGRRPEHD